MAGALYQKTVAALVQFGKAKGFIAAEPSIVIDNRSMTFANLKQLSVDELRALARQAVESTRTVDQKA